MSIYEAASEKGLRQDVKWSRRCERYISISVKGKEATQRISVRDGDTCSALLNLFAYIENSFRNKRSKKKQIGVEMEYNCAALQQVSQIEKRQCQQIERRVKWSQENWIQCQCGSRESVQEVNSAFGTSAASVTISNNLSPLDISKRWSSVELVL